MDVLSCCHLFRVSLGLQPALLQLHELASSLLCREARLLHALMAGGTGSASTLDATGQMVFCMCILGSARRRCVCGGRCWDWVIVSEWCRFSAAALQDARYYSFHRSRCWRWWQMHGGRLNALLVKEESLHVILVGYAAQQRPIMWWRIMKHVQCWSFVCMIIAAFV